GDGPAPVAHYQRASPADGREHAIITDDDAIDVTWDVSLDEDVALGVPRVAPDGCERLEELRVVADVQGHPRATGAARRLRDERIARGAGIVQCALLIVDTEDASLWYRGTGTFQKSLGSTLVPV